MITHSKRAANSESVGRQGGHSLPAAQPHQNGWVQLASAMTTAQMNPLPFRLLSRRCSRSITCGWLHRCHLCRSRYDHAVPDSPNFV